MTLDTNHLYMLKPNETTCCKPFVPHCDWNSGSIIAPIPFSCPTAKVRIATDNSVNASEAACCGPYVKSCKIINDQGDVHQCPASMTSIRPPPELEPTDANCCKASTCGEVSMTCKDVSCGIGYVSNDAVASKVVGGQDGTTKNTLCYMLTPAFSGASSLQASGVAALAVAALLLF
jgi:hypothetical protein